MTEVLYMHSFLQGTSHPPSTAALVMYPAIAGETGQPKHTETTETPCPALPSTVSDVKVFNLINNNYLI